MASRRTSSLFVWALFVLVAGGCATGVIADPGDGGNDPSDTGASGSDSGSDSQTADSGSPDTGRADSGSADTGVCSQWAGPTVTSTCTDMCNTTTHVCGPNGCYNMWWCNIPSGVCSAKPPTGCL